MYLNSAIIREIGNITDSICTIILHQRVFSIR